MFRINRERIEADICRLSPSFTIDFLVAPNRNKRQISTRHHVPTYEKVFDVIVKEVKEKFGSDVTIRRLSTEGAVLGAFEINIQTVNSQSYLVFSKLKFNKFPTVNLIKLKLSHLLGTSLRTGHLSNGDDAKNESKNESKEASLCRIVIQVFSIHDGKRFKILGERDYQREEDHSLYQYAYLKGFDKIGKISAVVGSKAKNYAYFDIEAGNFCTFEAEIPGYQQLWPSSEDAILIDEKGPAFIRIFMGVKATVAIYAKTTSGFMVPNIPLHIQETNESQFGIFDKSFTAETNTSGILETTFCFNSKLKVTSEGSECFLAPKHTYSFALTHSVQRKSNGDEFEDPSQWLYDSDSSEDSHIMSSMCWKSNHFMFTLDSFEPKWRWCSLCIPSVEAGNSCICVSSQRGIRLRALSKNTDGHDSTHLWSPCWCAFYDYSTPIHVLTLKELALVPRAPIEVRLGHNSNWVKGQLLRRSKSRKLVCKFEQKGENIVKVDKDCVRPAPVALCNDKFGTLKNKLMKCNMFYYGSTSKPVSLIIDSGTSNGSIGVGDKLTLYNGSFVGIVSGVVDNSTHKIIEMQNGIQLNIFLGTKLFRLFDKHKSGKGTLVETGATVSGIIGGFIFPTFGSNINGVHGPLVAYIGMQKGVFKQNKPIPSVLFGAVKLSIEISNRKADLNVTILSEVEWKMRTNNVTCSQLSADGQASLLSSDKWGNLPAPPGSVRVFAKCGEEISITMECHENSYSLKPFEVKPLGFSSRQVLSIPEPIQKRIEEEQERRAITLLEQNGSAYIIQKHCRRCLERMRFAKQNRSASLIQNHWKGALDRARFAELRNVAKIIQYQYRKWSREKTEKWISERSNILRRNSLTRRIQRFARSNLFFENFEMKKIEFLEKKTTVMEDENAKKESKNINKKSTNSYRHNKIQRDEKDRLLYEAKRTLENSRGQFVSKQEEKVDFEARYSDSLLSLDANCDSRDSCDLNKKGYKFVETKQRSNNTKMKSKCRRSETEKAKTKESKKQQRKKKKKEKNERRRKSPESKPKSRKEHDFEHVKYFNDTDAKIVQTDRAKNKQKESASIGKSSMRRPRKGKHKHEKSEKQSSIHSSLAGAPILS